MPKPPFTIFNNEIPRGIDNSSGLSSYEKPECPTSNVSQSDEQQQNNNSNVAHLSNQSDHPRMDDPLMFELQNNGETGNWVPYGQQAIHPENLPLNVSSTSHQPTIFQSNDNDDQILDFFAEGDYPIESEADEMDSSFCVDLEEFDNNSSQRTITPKYLGGFATDFKTFL
jgi:hypothetical protein